MTISAEVRAKAREAVRLRLKPPYHYLPTHLDSIIDAILAEVVGPERVIVPRVPTANMARAATGIYTEGLSLMPVSGGPVQHQPGSYVEHNTAMEVWRAMISASQEGNDGDSLARSLKETG